MSAPESQSYAYATLITRPSYMTGVIVLAHTLRKSTPSNYPFYVLYTPATLPSPCVDALQRESAHTNLVLVPIEPLLPSSKHNITLIAERFGDTWSKLRVFSLFDKGHSRICYLDADMTIQGNVERVFEISLPSSRHISATHACVCNLDADAWAPDDWTASNCAYTPMSHPSALSPSSVTPSTGPSAIPTHRLLNSGIFVFEPSRDLWDAIINEFDTSPKLESYKFPDQDFLTDFFADRWVPLPWCFNALKTWRYWHTNIWRDEEVVVLHYIVDKPWVKRVGEDGVAGYLGKDGVTHQWWWDRFRTWEEERRADPDDSFILAVINKYTASTSGDESDELRAIGSKVQAFAKNKVPAYRESR